MENRTYLDSFHVAGFQYYNGASVWPELRVGTILEIIPEPDNRHDEYALAILFNGQKIGFVPSQRNRMLAKLLNAGYLTDALELIVQKKDGSEHPEKQLRVGMFLKPVE